jgi:hypothetical protein
MRELVVGDGGCWSQPRIVKDNPTDNVPTGQCKRPSVSVVEMGLESEQFAVAGGIVIDAQRLPVPQVDACAPFLADQYIVHIVLKGEFSEVAKHQLPHQKGII